MERLTVLTLTVLLSCALHAQEVERALRDGNKAYKKGDTKDAIRSYSNAQKDDRGVFNLGNAFYRQDSFPDARSAYESAAARAKDAGSQARAYHNLGNSWMSQQKYEEAASAYKEALKRDPNDNDTRYNLAYAQKKLQQQQQKKKDDQQKQDQNKDQQQKQDPKQGDQPKDQQQDPKKGDGKDPKDQQQRPGQIDQQDAMRMLDASQQQEKNTQDKVRAKVQAKQRVPSGKDW